MQIRQISIFLENRRGQLSQICRDLADAGVNIAALSLADTSDFGIVRMIVDDHERAREALLAKGHAVRVSQVLAVCVPDRPGGMAEVMKALDAAGADVEYSYGFALHRSDKAVLVFRFADNEAAARALAAAGLMTLNEDMIADARRAAEEAKA